MHCLWEHTDKTSIFAAASHVSYLLRLYGRRLFLYILIYGLWLHFQMAPVSNHCSGWTWGCCGACAVLWLLGFMVQGL